MALVQDIGPMFRGEDVTFVFTMTPTTDITGWTISFRMKRTMTDASPVISQNATITNAGSGIFQVALTSSTTTTVPAGIYAYDVWRTDSGSAAALSIGTITVRSSSRVP